MNIRTFKQLDAARRGQIEALVKEGLNQTAIAKRLKVHKSSVSRELSRHSAPYGYRADMAQARHENKRRKCKPKNRMDNPDIRAYVLEHIRRGWSPETIVGRIKDEIKSGKLSENSLVNHESIYQFIYESAYGQQEKLYQYLRRGQRRRHKHKGRTCKTERLQNRVFIDQRPESVNSRESVGHWETDSIIYPNKKAINSLVERKSRFACLSRLERKTAEQTRLAITSRLQYHVTDSITGDNGTENALHETIAKELQADFYFCHPYHSWEKGSNENLNGLVRRYLPKRTNIDNLTQEELNAIADELNDRPRKILGYKTPREILKAEYGKINHSVAFRD